MSWGGRRGAYNAGRRAAPPWATRREGQSGTPAGRRARAGPPPRTEPSPMRLATPHDERLRAPDGPVLRSTRARRAAGWVVAADGEIDLARRRAARRCSTRSRSRTACSSTSRRHLHGLDRHRHAAGRRRGGARSRHRAGGRPSTHGRAGPRARRADAVEARRRRARAGPPGGRAADLGRSSTKSSTRVGWNRICVVGQTSRPAVRHRRMARPATPEACRSRGQVSKPAVRTSSVAGRRADHDDVSSQKCVRARSGPAVEARSALVIALEMSRGVPAHAA